jgi:tetratricopeptide (TPR) repeat protein
MDDLEARDRKAPLIATALIPVVRTFRSAVVVVMCAVLTGACSAPWKTPAESASPTLAPPEGRGLRPVPRPEFSTMGDAVRQRVQQAYTALTRVVEDRPATPEQLEKAYGEVGDLLMALNELESAEPYYLNAQTLEPGDRRWPYLLGHLYQTRGPLESAATSFERARQLQPNDVPTLIRLGEVYLALGRYEVAAPLFDQAIALAPGSAAAWFDAGQAALARHDDRAAVKALETALERDAGATAVHYPLAMAYQRLGNLHKARAHLAQQGKVEPRPEDPVLDEIEKRIDSALLFEFRGGRAMAAGEWATAADFFEKALALSPDSAAMRHRLALALFRMGDTRGAEEQFERVVGTTPSYRESHYNLAMIKAGNGRMEEALARVSTALEHDAGFMPARLLRARLLAVTGRPAEALAQYTTGLELEPLNPDAALGFGMTLALLDRFTEARDRLTEGARTFPDKPGFKWTLARLLAAAPDDRLRNARAALTMAEKLLGESQKSFDDGVAIGETYAMALAESGQYATAAAVQRDIRATVQKAGGLDDVLRRVDENLNRYERGLPCRRPWTPEELPI